MPETTEETVLDRLSLALSRAARGEPLAAADVAAIFRISSGQFTKLEKAGAWEQFKLRPALGPKRFSGVLVQRYLNGEPLVDMSFGRKRRG